VEKKKRWWVEAGAALRWSRTARRSAKRALAREGMESIADAVWLEDCVGREDETTRGEVGERWRWWWLGKVE
jgi:hypothetical protein